MLLSPRKNGLTSLFKEVRVFKGVQLALTGSTLWRRPNCTKVIPASQACVTDVLCDYKVNSKIEDVCVCAINHFGPHSNSLG